MKPLSKGYLGPISYDAPSDGYLGPLDDEDTKHVDLILNFQPPDVPDAEHESSDVYSSTERVVSRPGKEFPYI